MVVQRLKVLLGVRENYALQGGGELGAVDAPVGAEDSRLAQRFVDHQSLHTLCSRLMNVM